MTLAPLLADLLGEDLPVGIRTFDGESVGPPDPPATLVVRSPDALRRVLFAPGEIGFARAYVAGDLDIEGDIHVLLRSLRDRLPNVHLSARQWVRLAEEVGARQLRPLPPPPEEIRLRGRRHSKARDALGGHRPLRRLERVLPAPARPCPHVLVCRVRVARRHPRGGPGGQARPDLPQARPPAGHAGARHRVRLGVLRHPRRDPLRRLGGRRVALGAPGRPRPQAGGRGRADRPRGPPGAGLPRARRRPLRRHRLRRHGRARRAGHCGTTPGWCTGSSSPGARYLHHSIAKAGPESDHRWRPTTPTFIDRYVFPDSKLHRIGATVSALEGVGLEVRHVESLREHYAMTLRHWTANLEAGWDEAVAQIGLPRARIWHLYLAGCALVFDVGNVQVHQCLTVRSRGRRRPPPPQALLRGLSGSPRTGPGAGGAARTTVVPWLTTWCCTRSVTVSHW